MITDYCKFKNTSVHLFSSRNLAVKLLPLQPKKSEHYAETLIVKWCKTFPTDERITMVSTETTELLSMSTRSWQRRPPTTATWTTSKHLHTNKHAVHQPVTYNDLQ